MKKKVLIWKVLFVSTFLFCGCSVGVLTLRQDVARHQFKRWQSYTLRGTAEIWQDSKQIEQKIYINKDTTDFSIVCYGGGVFGMTPVPSLSLRVKEDKVFYRDKTLSEEKELNANTDKSLYSVLYAMSRLEEVYTSGIAKIGRATVKLDKLGNPVQISSGSLKVVFSYENNELQKLEIYFGRKKILETKELGRS